MTDDTPRRDKAEIHVIHERASNVNGDRRVISARVSKRKRLVNALRVCVILHAFDMFIYPRRPSAEKRQIILRYRRVDNDKSNVSGFRRAHSVRGGVRVRYGGKLLLSSAIVNKSLPLRTRVKLP